MEKNQRCEELLRLKYIIILLNLLTEPVFICVVFWFQL